MKNRAKETNSLFTYIKGLKICDPKFSSVWSVCFVCLFQTISEKSANYVFLNFLKIILDFFCVKILFFIRFALCLNFFGDQCKLILTCPLILKNRAKVQI